MQSKTANYMLREYNLMSDEEVVELATGGDKSALEYIMTKHKNLVRAKARTYFLIGADREDIIQEGMIGLFKAIRDFDAGKQASFKSFAEICVTRQLISAVKSATRMKHMPLNTYISLNKPAYEEESERMLIETLKIKSLPDPEETFIVKENISKLEDMIKEVLSRFERSVLEMYLEGLPYVDIAEKLGRTPKAIDNALQRIKRKFESYKNI